jgi:aspartyl-tRNA(Asn)/glutamyl-tRNA(Gln) amidotransferase subunit A
MASTDGLHTLTASEAARRIREGTLSPVALAESCLARINAIEGQVQAWAHLDEAGALGVAREREAEARSGRIRGPWHGVPIGVKDIFHVAGMPTRAGAKAFAHSRPAEDATSVARLRAAGAVILGKTATTEFAYRHPSPARNPWNLDHTPGGSSSGSGAAVAAGMVPLALGTQTVGSVLRPAAYCGVVGYKGTHGLVDATGVLPLAWSLDHVGVLARAVGDAALGLAVLTGRDIPGAPVPAPPRIGVLSELVTRAAPDVAAQLRAAADGFARAGARVAEVKLPASFAALAEAGQIVLEAEAAAYHEADFARHAADYSEPLGALIRTGLGRTAREYVHASRARQRARTDLLALLTEHDAVLSPTAPTPAPAGLAFTGDASFCAPWSSTGLPSVSLPSGVAASGLPYAVQLSASAGADAQLLAVAAWCERVLSFTAVPPR